MVITTWQMGLFKKVKNISAKSGTVGNRRLSSILRNLAARVEEKSDQKMTKLLETYPDMPPKFFSACMQVSYGTGVNLYKEWHKLNGKNTPPKKRLSAVEEAKWAGILLDELFETKKFEIT